MRFSFSFVGKMGRACTVGEGRKSKLYVRTSVSYMHKADVIDMYEQCANVSETVARIYGVLSVEKAQKKHRLGSGCAIECGFAPCVRQEREQAPQPW